MTVSASAFDRECPFCGYDFSQTRQGWPEYVEHLEDHADDTPWLASERGADAVSDTECLAIRCLYVEGHNLRVLARAFGRSISTISRHVFGHCEEHRTTTDIPQRVGRIPR